MARALKCKYFENEMYSFLKSEDFSGDFVCICLQSHAGLMEKGKIRVRQKGRFRVFCIGKGRECRQNDTGSFQRGNRRYEKLH